MAQFSQKMNMYENKEENQNNAENLSFTRNQNGYELTSLTGQNITYSQQLLRGIAE